MLGRRAIASGSVNGRSAASISGHRMLVSFHGSHDIARVAVDGRAPLRGEKLGRDGGHPIEQRAEEHLRVEPRERGVVTPVGQGVEAAERLPSFEWQFDLPAESVAVEAPLGIESAARGGREQGWDDRPLEAWFAAMARAIPEAPLFPEVAAFVDALREAGRLGGLEGERPESRDARVAAICAAANTCLGTWSGRDFVERCDRVMWNSRYDAIDALAPALYILVAWPQAAPREVKRT